MMSSVRCIRQLPNAGPLLIKSISNKGAFVSLTCGRPQMAGRGERLISITRSRWAESREDSRIALGSPRSIPRSNARMEEINGNTEIKAQEQETSLGSEAVENPGGYQAARTSGSENIIDDTSASSGQDVSTFISSDAFLPGNTDHDRTRLIRRLLELSENERALLEHIRQTEHAINSNLPNDKQIGVYYTGGFVRDKLLGRQPFNIDIVLLNISPAEFVQTLIDHVGWDDHRGQRLWPLDMVKISATEQKSRRGACRTHRFEYGAPSGTTIEVVGLIQYYLEITMEFVGVPGELETEANKQAALVEDAMQRELTVNALYIRSRDLAILDPSGMGLKDLHERVFRTPRAPRQALLADPIRVLRAIKFIGRYQDDGFTPDPALTQALKDSRVKEALLTSYDKKRINREVAITLSPKNNPYRVLQIIRGVGYYKDLFYPPPPTDASPGRTRDFLHPTTMYRDFFAAGYFIHRLSNKWELWAPFEEALYNLPSKGYVQSDWEKCKVMMSIRENVLSFAYAIAIALPYQHVPPPASFLKKLPADEAKTVPGQIVEQLSNRLIRPWQLIDQMFLHPRKTVESIHKVLKIETTEQWKAFLAEYGPYWAGYVLCAAILRWTDLAREAKWAAEYDVLWRKSERSWIELSKAVDKVRWVRWSAAENDPGIGVDKLPSSEERQESEL